MVTRTKRERILLPLFIVGAVFLTLAFFIHASTVRATTSGPLLPPLPNLTLETELDLPTNESIGNEVNDILCNELGNVEDALNNEDIDTHLPPGHCADDNGDEKDGGEEPQNTPPTIALVGESEMTITMGELFTDPGATATDAEDGDLSSDIVTEGSVDTSTPGSYTLIYTVEDSEGAQASVTRVVIVNAVDDEEENGDGDDDGGDDNGAGNEDSDEDEESSNGGGSSGGSGGGSVQSTPGGTGNVLGVAPVEPTFLFEGACNAHLTSFIRFGASNDPAEVRKLQSFLINEEGFTGVQITGVYDAVTRSAVLAFQERYRGDILGPWGISDGTGYVYITTRKKINELHCDNAREFALTQAERVEIERVKNQIQTAEENEAPLPETLEIGQALEEPNLAQGGNKAEASDDRDKEIEETNDQLAGAGEAETRGVVNNIANWTRGFIRGLLDVLPF